MAKFLVAASDSVFPDLNLATEILATIGAELKLAPNPTPEAIVQTAGHADALLTTYATISGETIRQMARCRIISRFGIGVDNVDISAATSAGMVVTRVPDYCLDEVSDHTMALLLALVRKLVPANSQVQTGKWEMAAVVPIHRIRGGVLGLVGFGRISRQVAAKAKVFGMSVVTYDPYVKAEVTAREGVESVGFDRLLAISDYVSIHAPLIAETSGLFCAKAFRQMKPTSYLVNTARGMLIDEAALAYALDAGQLAGAALDVMAHEPPSNSPLLGRANVILTPHTSFYSIESLIDLQTKAVDEVVRVLSNKPPLNPVNPEAIAPNKA
jgi:D-3-phosphoglycerate dehydrogenase / 2-oxoglutarate reductase